MLYIDVRKVYNKMFKELNLSDIKEIKLVDLAKFQDCPVLGAFRLKEVKEKGKARIRDDSKQRLKDVTDCFKTLTPIPRKDFDVGQLALYQLVKEHFEGIAPIQTLQFSFNLNFSHVEEDFNPIKLVHQFIGVVLIEKYKKHGGPLEVHTLSYLKRAMQVDELRFGIINRILSIFLFEMLKLKQPPLIYCHFARLMKNRGEDMNNKPSIDTLSFQHSIGEMKRGGAMMMDLLTRFRKEDLFPVDVARFCRSF